MRCLVRVACLADARAIHELESRVFTTDRLSRRSIRRLIAAGSARVLVGTNGHAIAAALVMLYRRGSAHARLYSLAVDPRWRAQGIGSRLLSQALDRARREGRSEMRLEVRRDNHAARSFYVGHGFVEAGRRERFYQDGETALIYVRPTGSRRASPEPTRRPAVPTA